MAETVLVAAAVAMAAAAWAGRRLDQGLSNALMALSLGLLTAAMVLLLL